MNPSSLQRDASPPTSPLVTTSTKETDDQLAQSLRHMSLATASQTPLPPSPQVSGSPKKALGQRNLPSSPATTVPKSSLHRSPSAMSLDGRSATPSSLQRKASMNSLRGVGATTPSRTTSQSRRSSSAQYTNGAANVGKSPLSGIEDEPAPPPRATAADVARDYFRKKLDVQESDSFTTDSIVILHDSCYGHRYSRPRTSKAGLSTIVERPERIHASILGLSIAYVRLGERHAEGQFAIHPKTEPSKLPNIPFRIRKTTRRLALSSPAVTNVHGVKWMEELKIMCDNAEARLAMNGKELTRPDVLRSPEQAPPPKLHEGDLFLCSESLDAMEGALGAVCEGVDAVFDQSRTPAPPRRAFVAIRPPGHHCSASYPSGFCWLNNVHVGISHAALAHGLTHAAIIDFDLHHGDGSQAIAWEHNLRAQGLPKNAAAWKKTSIGYFSLHDINSYPCEMGDEEKVKNASLCIENAHGQSIWNVHLQPWKSEAEFWELYETKYAILLEKTRNFLRLHTQKIRSIPSSTPNAPQPRSAIFLSAGFDASEWESSGMQRHKVNVPTEFYARLTRDVVRLALEEDCSAGGRVISVLEGGYSDRALSSGVLSHISGLVGGNSTQINAGAERSGLGYEMAKKVGSDVALPSIETANSDRSYDASWWSLSQLELLDATINPPAPPAEPKKPKEGPPPTYFSPTQSFSAKIVGSPKGHRSLSGMSNLNGSSVKLPSRGPSPLPPDVYWTTAAYELSKLLIPADRQTKSCKPEDLSAEASRARRERQSILTLPTDTANGEVQSSISAPQARMALRERKAAKLPAPEEEEDKPLSRVNRRKTVAGGAVLVTDKATPRSTTPKPEPGYSQPTKQSARRLSMISNSGSVTSEAPQINGHGRTSSIGQNGLPNRPPSAQSVRAESVISSRGHSIPPIAVKKTRTVNPANPTKPRVTKKSPPQPPVRTTSVSQSESTIDSVTNGMKNIKINLTTKAQREAKAKVKPSPGPDASRVAPPKKQASKTAKIERASDVTFKSESEEPQLPPTRQTRSRPPTPSTPQAPIGVQARIATLQEAAAVPLPASSPLQSTTEKSSVSDRQPVEDTGLFIPYQPEGPTPVSQASSEPLKWLPPNTGTPVSSSTVSSLMGSSPMKRGDPNLPSWSATGVIPFGVAGVAKKEKEKKENVKADMKRESEMSIWDVPETPKK